MQSNLCQAARTPRPQTSRGAVVNGLPVVAHEKLHWCFEERREDTCLQHIWPLSPNKGRECNSAKDRAWSPMVQRVQCPITGRARTSHKLLAGSFNPLTQSTPRKPAFYPELISREEKLCVGKSADAQHWIRAALMRRKLKHGSEMHDSMENSEVY